MGTLPPEDLTQAPVIAGSDTGLEVVWWTAPEDAIRFARSLQAYAALSVPMDSAARALWMANGMRIVAVPIARLGALREQLGVLPGSQREWLGQAAAWTEAIRGPERGRGQTIALDAERLQLGPGRLRVLARCWPVPVPPEEGNQQGAAAALHIELLPQHHETRPKFDPARALSTPTTLAPQDDGLLFRRLLATMTVRGGIAYVIVPERPGVSWSDLVGDQPIGAARPPNVADAPKATGAAPLGHVVRSTDPGSASSEPASGGSADPATVVAGPAAPGVPTIGQAMLMVGAARPAPDEPSDAPSERIKEGQRVGGLAARSFIVLIPRLPERYWLLGP